jgi:phospholipid/cholesterol/gamma-HCH transport system ATP-binding protein
LDSNELNRIHTQWGVVLQRNALFSGTVLDNIELWLREVRNLDTQEILPIARRVLKAVLLPYSADFLHTNIVSLSGCMSKRLAVARALSIDPVVMFFDEPTTGLDPTSAAQVHELILATHEIPLADCKQRTTVIIIRCSTNAFKHGQLVLVRRQQVVQSVHNPHPACRTSSAPATD